MRYYVICDIVSVAGREEVLMRVVGAMGAMGAVGAVGAVGAMGAVGAVLALMVAVPVSPRWWL